MQLGLTAYECDGAFPLIRDGINSRYAVVDSFIDR